MTPQAASFYTRGRFSAVRTLSPENPALIALSELPIEVPYHSVIGQHRRGSKEEGSDGVVPYWSSRLDGAQSEVIVRSGHAVLTNLVHWALSAHLIGTQVFGFLALKVKQRDGLLRGEAFNFSDEFSGDLP